MPSELLSLLYAGKRDEAHALARDLPRLDLFEAAALGELDTLTERVREDAACIARYSDDGWTPLHLAAFFGNDACAVELLRLGASVDARSRNGAEITPLHSACAGEHLAVAVTLIAAGADVNAQQTGGHRPLDSALRAGNVELANRLRAAGALRGASSSGALSPAT